MSAEYFILKTLVKNGGSMSLAAFLNETRSKQSKYDSRYIRKNMLHRNRIMPYFNGRFAFLPPP